MAHSTHHQNNLNVFDIYAQGLGSSDPKKYVPFARRFAIWLNNDKAYYPEGRPEILKLLLIAHFTLRDALGYNGARKDLDPSFHVSNFDTNPLLIEAYTHLMKTVQPFAHHFDGDAGHGPENLKLMLDSITERKSQEMSHSPSLTTPTTQSIAPQQSPAQNVIPRATTFDAQILKNATPTIGNSSKGHELAVPDQVPTPATTSTSQVAKKIKNKKKKLMDVTSLFEKDKQHRQAKRTQSHPGPTLPGNTPTAPPTVSSTPALSIPPPNSMPPPSVLSTTSTKLSGSIDSEKATETEAAEDLKLATFSENKNSPAIVMSTHGSPHNVHPTAPPTVDNQTIASVDEPMDVEDSGIDPKQPTEQSLKASSEPQFTESVEAAIDHMNLDDPMPMERQQKTSQAEEPTPMDIDAKASEPSVSLQVASRDNIPPPDVLVEPKIVPTHLSPVADAAPSTEDHRIGIFGPEMRIIAQQEGLELKTGSCILIQFSILEAQIKKIFNWVKKYEYRTEVKTSICLTLGCYSTADLQERAKDPTLDTFVKQVSSTPSRWPQNGELSVRVNKSSELTLSPPYVVTPDNLFDISRLLVVDQNVVELNQRRDLREYMFILHVHYPTRLQLEKVKNDQSLEGPWREFMIKSTQPIPYVTLRHLRTPFA